MVHVLHFIYDFRAALSHAYRGLEPGGVLLCTVPCIRPVVQGENNGGRKDYWRFTEASIRSVFAETFPLDSFEVSSYGNVMVDAALLLGLSTDALPDGSLENHDAFIPAVCCVRAVKPMTPNSADVRMQSPAVVSLREPREFCGAILFYHRIAKLTPDTHGLCVSPDDFRDHMKHLRQNYCPISLRELVERAAKWSLPSRAVAVTLDDGYLDNLTTASPILSEFEIPATFFATTGMINEKHEYWWDTLERVFISEQPIPPTLDLYGDGSRVCRTETRMEREAVHQGLIELVYRMSSEDRDFVINRIAAWSGMDLTPRDTHRPMLANELVTLAERPGHTIGVHTVNHLSLPLHSLEVQLTEIKESKKTLERLLGRSVTAFSYPFGEFSKETIEIVKEASVEIAFTVEGRLLHMGANPFLLPRFEIKACEVKKFSEQMSILFAPKRSSVVPDPLHC
jgi:peptidoglycan/xylan/chitin deacetylase (PgdA/CDA1 family)